MQAPPGSQDEPVGLSSPPRRAGAHPTTPPAWRLLERRCRSRSVTNRPFLIHRVEGLERAPRTSGGSYWLVSELSAGVIAWENERSAQSVGPCIASSCFTRRAGFVRGRSTGDIVRVPSCGYVRPIGRGQLIARQLALRGATRTRGEGGRWTAGSRNVAVPKSTTELIAVRGAWPRLRAQGRRRRVLRARPLLGSSTSSETARAWGAKYCPVRGICAGLRHR